MKREMRACASVRVWLRTATEDDKWVSSLYSFWKSMMKYPALHDQQPTMTIDHVWMTPTSAHHYDEDDKDCSNQIQILLLIIETKYRKNFIQWTTTNNQPFMKSLLHM